MVTEPNQCPCKKSIPLEVAVSSAMLSLGDIMKKMLDDLTRYEFELESREHLLARTLPILSRAIHDLEPLASEYSCDAPPLRDSKRSSRK